MVPRPDVLGEVLAPFGARLDEATLVRAHFAGVHALDLAGEETGGWAAYRSAYVTHAGVPTGRVRPATQAMDEIFDHWLWSHPMPGARQALAALHERGVPIGVVSNAAGQVEGDLCRVGICQVGDGGEGVPVRCVVDSSVVGVSKPDPGIFAPALAALGLEPSPRVAYVGDTVLYDVRAATAAGLTPLLHDPHGFHERRPTWGRPRTLRSLADLVALLTPPAGRELRCPTTDGGASTWHAPRSGGSARG